MRLCRRFLLVAAAVALCPLPAGAQTVATHDNLKPAGTLRDGVLTLSLRAGMGQWSPSGPGTQPVSIAALGEEGGPLQIPSPLLRVPEGTLVRVTVRNTLGLPLRVTGLCDRPGRCQPLVIASGAAAQTSFRVTAAGTYHYWGSTGPESLEERFADDSQLGGALVVDGAGDATDERIFVLGLKRPALATLGDDLTVINGRSWPATERLAYRTGETARWRVLNLTLDPHAMHLHGFYFRVTRSGDGATDTRHGQDQVRDVVTHQMAPGRTISLAWTPERPGNWLFHCHMLVHMMPAGHEAHAAAQPDAPAAGMAGLVLGVTVTGPDRSARRADVPRRPLTMTIEDDTRNGDIKSYKVSVESGGQPAPRLNTAASPGPVLVLTRGEPVAVEIRNRLKEPTAIHWHGIELESYDDGVPGFGGVAGSVTPPVAPGGTFTARFTPARAGTFIYHTHWHNPEQLSGGIYGPLVVLEPGETYRPETDHVIMLGLDGRHEGRPEPFAINGEKTPRPVLLRKGVTNRLRLINITPNNVAITVQLMNRLDPGQWVPIGKDGASIPESQRKPQMARQLVSVGETYDFELPPLQSAGPMWLEIRRGNGELLLQWPVRLSARER